MRTRTWTVLTFRGHGLSTSATRRPLCLDILATCSVLLTAPNGLRAQGDSFNSYLLYLGESPSNAGPEWDGAPAGLAHGAEHWYITQNDRIWRIPVAMDLGDVQADSPGVTSHWIEDIPGLWQQGYNRLGDLCAYPFQGIDYVLVPVWSESSGLPSRLAVFRGDESLTLISVGPLSDLIWCAVDGAGTLYGVVWPFWVGQVLRYDVNWEYLAQHSQLVLSGKPPIALRDAGGALTELENVWGGAVTSDGRLLYLGERYGDSNGGGAIHVFDVATGWRAARSAENAYPFMYMENAYLEQTGGVAMDIWDLERTTSPHPGQLHVLLADRDDFSSNDVSIKHYTRTVRVDTGTGCLPQDRTGTPACPFRAIREARDYAWDGAEIRIRYDDYNETVTISKRVLLTAVGGTVVIGR